MHSASKDFVKSVINIPKRMLILLNIYPEKQNKFTKLVFAIMLLSVTSLELGQSIYTILNFTDLVKVAQTCTTVSTNFQGITKLTILFINLNSIKKMLQVVWFEFWPVDIADINLRNSLRRHCQLATFNMMGIYASAIFFAAKFLSLPLFLGQRILPFSASLPFDWTKSPVYEIMYASQVFTNVYIIITSICGHDFLFVALMINAIAQFRLLKYVMRNICGEKSEHLNEFLEEFLKDDNDKIKHADIDINLMRKCIRHHIKLLKFCDNLENVFSATVFTQYVASVSAICMSSFLITLIEDGPISYLVSFCLGHVCQLFLYCAVGNELLYQSREVGCAISESNWYLSDNKQLRKNLIMIIQRSQKEKKITALGFTDLNFESFLNVLKLSFSFHTLLSTINEK